MEMTIGTNIKRLRMSKNITQEQLSAVMNVTCAAVSKWERGETYPDITLLQPLAYYFGISLDELMGYNQEKIRTKIEETLNNYRNVNKTDPKEARKIITKAYRDYPNDYYVLHYYMWNIGGDMADNDPSVLLLHKNEFLSICNKILENCTEETLRLNAWNMRAKILHAEGKTDEALEIYQNKFTNWYNTIGQKSEQLFAKNTVEYYYWVQKNMYELADFAADKLGRVIFFDATLSIKDRTEKALKYGDLILNMADETGEAFFVLIAYSFFGRIKNDLVYRGGSDEDIILILDKYLYSTQKLTEFIKNDSAFCEVFMINHPSVKTKNVTEWTIDFHLNNNHGKYTQLLKNPNYINVLEKFDIK